MHWERNETVGKRKKPGSVTLAEDQVWQVNRAYAHIVTIDKRLVHYKMANSPMGRSAKIAPVKVGTHEAVQEYLRVNKGVLVTSPS